MVQLLITQASINVCRLFDTSHYGDITWVPRRLRITGNLTVCSTFFQVNYKENIRANLLLAICAGNPPVNSISLWITLTNDQKCERFPCYGDMMNQIYQCVALRFDVLVHMNHGGEWCISKNWCKNTRDTLVVKELNSSHVKHLFCHKQNDAAKYALQRMSFWDVINRIYLMKPRMNWFEDRQICIRVCDYSYKMTIIFWTCIVNEILADDLATQDSQ